MAPLSLRRRRILFLLLALVFFLVAPVAALYATGYRFSGLTLVETGGLYISAPVGVTISINGKEKGTTGLLTRAFYVDDLAPGTYTVDASSDGAYPWHKTLIVEPKIVTDAAVFLVPQDIRALPIAVGTSTATTTRYVSRAELLAFARAFRPATTSLESASSTPLDTKGGATLSIEDGDVILSWTRDSGSVPSAFCLAPSSCRTSFPIKKNSGETAVSARFFGGGVVYATKESGIFLAEADRWPVQFSLPLYSHRGADFRIINGQLIVKDGTEYYQIVGL
jgi:hypothetical protein